MDLEPQSVPDNIVCPGCGRDVSDEFHVKHGLSKSGYLHDDISMRCGDCGERWVHGVPIGSAKEFEDDLTCGCCGGYVLVHRVNVLPDSDEILLELKCPACYRFNKVTRRPDENGVALVGYPQITGKLNTEQAYGYNREDVEE